MPIIILLLEISFDFSIRALGQCYNRTNDTMCASAPGDAKKGNKFVFDLALRS
jgi:hypothetical protein